MEGSNSSRSKEEQLKQVEEAIVTQNIAIDKKDAFALSHLNLVFFLSNNDSVETVKEKLQPIINEEKEAVYKQWFAKEKENKMVDQLELKFVEGYISNYIKKFQIR